jgi:hypothetical protein
MVRDISSEGIGLLLGRRFEPGAMLSIELTDAHVERPRLLLARVVHAELVGPLSDEEVHALR